MSTLQLKTCYHHCVVFNVKEHGGTHTSYENCKVNPGHENFMTVEQFKRKAPTDYYPDEDDFTLIENLIDSTVRVKVLITSTGRPDTYNLSENPYPLKSIRGSSTFVRFGTAFLDKKKMIPSQEADVTKPCSCLQCQDFQSQGASKSPSSSKPEFSEYFEVITATHVVFDTTEATNAVFEFFYDSEDRETVASIYGVCVLDDGMGRLETDRCRVTCVTHDSRLAETLSKLCDGRRATLFMPPSGFLISHPHGVSKRISAGKITSAKAVVVSTLCESPIEIKQNTQIRISGNPNIITDIAYKLNLIPLSYTLAECQGQCQHPSTFKMASSLTVSFPLRIAIECDIDVRNIKKEFLEGKHVNDRWWTLPPGVRFVMKDGSSFTFPGCDRTNIEESPMTFSIFIPGSVFKTQDLRYNDKPSTAVFRSNHSHYNYFVYDMASCVGSSGAMVFHDLWMYPYTLTCVPTHFGCCREGNASGLVPDVSSFRPMVSLRLDTRSFDDILNLYRDPRKQSHGISSYNSISG